MTGTASAKASSGTGSWTSAGLNAKTVPSSLELSTLFIFGHTAQPAGSSFPNQGSNLCPLQVEGQSSDHWTMREVPRASRFRTD